MVSLHFPTFLGEKERTSSCSGLIPPVAAKNSFWRKCEPLKAGEPKGRVGWKVSGELGSSARVASSSPKRALLHYLAHLDHDEPTVVWTTLAARDETLGELEFEGGTTDGSGLLVDVRPGDRGDDVGALAFALW